MLKFHPLVLVGLLACSATPPVPRGLPPPPPATTASAASGEASAPVAREVIAPGRLEALPIRIAAARGTDRAFAIFDVPDAEETLLAPLEEGGLGEPRRMVGHVAAVAGRGDQVWWVTKVGEVLCVEAPRGRACHPVEAKAAVALPDGLALVDARRHVVPEGRGPSKERVGAAPVEREPVAMEVVVQRFDAEGQRVGSYLDSGLRFDRPLEGMDLVDVAASPEGIALLYFEEAAPRRDGARKIPQARLRVAHLDREGILVEGSPKTLYEGDRKFGYIEGYHRPRLFGDGEHAVALARFVERKGGKVTAGWEAWSAAGRSLLVHRAWPGLRPLALVDAPDDDEQARLDALWQHAPRAIDGQPGSDAGRVAWVGARGWFLLDGALHFIDPDDDEPTSHPGLRVRRAALRWTDGERAITHAGLHSAAGLREVPFDGDVLASTEVAGAPWWVVRAPTRAGARLVGPRGEPGPPMPVGASAVAGPLRLVRDGPRLEISRWEGDRVETLAAVPTPIQGWLAAVPAGDGALVVGESTPGGELVSLMVTHAGALSEARSLGVKAPAPPHRSLQRRPGGAVVAADDAWLWLDAAGRPAGVATRVDPEPCDGGARPASIPAGPSTLVPWPPDLCLPQPPAVLADGRLAALALQTEGPHQDVVRVLLGASPPIPAAAAPEEIAPAAVATRRCPPDMVDVGDYCIDRFEGHLTDERGQLLSPHHPPTPGVLGTIFKAWAFGRLYEGDLAAHALPLPPLLRPVDATPAYRAQNALGAAPSAFLTGYAAKQACEAAGKRLCTHDEWVRACKGEEQTQFPYGDDYVQGRCNVFRYTHPARVLHDNPSIGHLDPRLNLVADHEGPLREQSGTRGTCASRWGDDAVYDMVGNLDEWFGGRGDSGFAGGFYARSTRKGCEAAITVHPRRYMDYSLGVRCCASAAAPRED